MPALLTYKSVMLLARARLIALRRDLNAKIGRRGARVTDLDHRMLYLAEQAILMLGDGPGIPDVDPPQDLASNISKFAVMGTAGPNLPGTGKILADENDWARQAMHGGRPDPARQRVMARTTDFVLEFWKQGQAKITASSLDANGKDNARKALRAFSLGHLCHVAADVVTQPWIDDLEAVLGRGPNRRFSFGRAGQLDSRVAVQVMDRDTPRDDSPWTAWWPAPEDVPEPFFEAFSAAFVEIYGANPTAKEADQLSNPYRQSLTGQSPPPMDPAFMKDAYDFWYHGVVGIAYGYRYWDWWLLFLPMFVTWLLQLIAYPLMPSLRDAFAKPAWDAPDGGRAMYDLVAFSLLSTGPAALTYGIAALALTNGGTSAEAGFGFASGLLLTLGLGVFFGTLGVSEADFPLAARIPLLIVLPAIMPIVFFILALTNRDRSVGGMQFMHGLPFVMMLVTLVLYFMPFLTVGALSGLAGAEDGGLIAIYVILAVLTAVGLGVAWFYASRALRDWFLPQTADETFEDRRREIRHSALTTDRNMLVRLFDESTLFHAPGLAAGAVDAGTLYYPTGRRPLIRLWWQPGAPAQGNVFVRSDRFQLVFANRRDGSDATVTVEAPIFPMNAAEYVAFLQGLGVTLSGVTGSLQAAVIDPADWDYELPAGATFSDHGDTQDTVEAHDREAARFEPLGTVNDDTAYVLYHSQTPALAARFGKSGPVVADGRESLPTPGQGTIRSDGNDVHGTNTHFDQFFVAGDRIYVNGQVRTILRVASPTLLNVASDFNPAIAAGAAYERVGDNWPTVGVGTVEATGNELRGAGTDFAAFFNAGDRVRVGGQFRTVQRVRSRLLLEVTEAFDPAVAAGASYERLGHDIEDREGFEFVAHLTQRVGGQTLMDRAADLGAMLCMGAVPHLIDNAAVASPDLSAKGGREMPKVYQVFRNWNLDRRRVNEWRMLIEGGALSEKGGQATTYDAAMLQPRPGGYNPRNYPAGEAAANQLGWVPLFRQWAAALGNNNDPLDNTGTPTPKSISQALAYLFDLPDPQAM